MYVGFFFYTIHSSVDGQLVDQDSAIVNEAAIHTGYNSSMAESIMFLLEQNTWYAPLIEYNSLI